LYFITQRLLKTRGLAGVGRALCFVDFLRADRKRCAARCKGVSEPCTLRMVFLAVLHSRSLNRHVSG